jgi:hypothetical protein
MVTTIHYWLLGVLVLLFRTHIRIHPILYRLPLVVDEDIGIVSGP